MTNIDKQELAKIVGAGFNHVMKVHDNKINTSVTQDLVPVLNDLEDFISTAVREARIDELEEVIKRNYYGMTKSQLGTLDRLAQLKEEK